MKKTLLAAAALMAAVSAQADTISFDYGLPIVQSTTEIDQTGSLGLFDSTLGTLTGAVLTIYSSAAFEYSGTNGSTGTVPANLTSGTDILWTSSLASLTSFLGTPLSLSSTSGFLSYASGETKTFGPVADSDSAVSDLATVLASLQTAGGGTFDLNCESFSNFTVGGGGGVLSTTQNTMAGCGASIVYTFDAAPPPPVTVPEPGSLALLGLALAGGYAATRRRKV